MNGTGSDLSRVLIWWIVGEKGGSEEDEVDRFMEINATMPVCKFTVNSDECRRETGERKGSIRCHDAYLAIRGEVEGPWYNVIGRWRWIAVYSERADSCIGLHRRKEKSFFWRDSGS